MREEIDEDIEVEARDSRAFYSDKGVEAFEKHLEKKGVCRKARVQESSVAFQRGGREKGLGNCEQAYGARERSIGERVLCPSWREKGPDMLRLGRWIPFRERVISRLLRLLLGRDCIAYD